MTLIICGPPPRRRENDTSRRVGACTCSSSTTWTKQPAARLRTRKSPQQPPRRRRAAARFGMQKSRGRRRVGTTFSCAASSRRGQVCVRFRRLLQRHDVDEQPAARLRTRKKPEAATSAPGSRQAQNVKKPRAPPRRRNVFLCTAGFASVAAAGAEP